MAELADPNRLRIGGLSIDESVPPFDVLAHQAVPLGRGEARRTLDVVAPLVEDAVARHARGEVVGWDIVVQAMPGPPLEGQTQPQWGPMILIYVDITPAAGLDNRILNVSNPLPPTSAGWDPDAVDTIVGTLLEGCFAMREQQFGELAAQVKQGHRSPGGVVLPG